MIALDTDAVSELLRPRPAPSLIDRLHAVPASEQATTAITIGELRYGTEKSGRPELFTAIVTRLQRIRVFPFDTAAAIEYGNIRAELERVGTPLADPDLRIAAIAVANDLVVLTGNVRHFRRVPGLAVETWER